IIFLFSFTLDISMLFGAFTTLLEMMVLCAFAILFSTITKPILGSVLTLTSFFVGHLTSALLLLKDRMEDAVSQFLIPIFYYISPNLEVFNFKTEIVHNLAIPWTAVTWAVAYSIIYSAIILIVSWTAFSKKDIE
ncbi:MAG: hypothetical protein MI741_21115, partial [Rhodospirillales bacterium]|nr:hypothetical protein [Rhodospirillales bacterium]